MFVEWEIGHFLSDQEDYVRPHFSLAGGRMLRVTLRKTHVSVLLLINVCTIS